MKLIKIGCLWTHRNQLFRPKYVLKNPFCLHTITILCQFNSSNKLHDVFFNFKKHFLNVFSSYKTLVQLCIILSCKMRCCSPFFLIFICLRWPTLLHCPSHRRKFQLCCMTELLTAFTALWPVIPSPSYIAGKKEPFFYLVECDSFNIILMNFIEIVNS